MLTKEQKTSLMAKLKDFYRDISEIRTQLNLLNDQKEAEFEKREAVSKQISELIRKVKTIRTQRNKFTSQVRQNKTAREKLRNSIKDNIANFKTVNKERKALMIKHNIKVAPDHVKKDIEKLEFKIETEALPFKDEKKIMKKINELKKQLKSTTSVNQVFLKSREISNEIDKLKKEHTNHHVKIQNFAKQGQKKHEEMLEVSKQIDVLREKESEYKEKFLKFKAEFTKVNQNLKETLHKLNELKKELDLRSKEKKKKSKKQIEENLKEKKIKVEEKIKKGEKLTTEDFLIFQRENPE